MQKAKSLPVRAKSKIHKFSYWESLTVALIEYTALSSVFAQELKKLCKHLRKEYKETGDLEIKAPKWLLPTDKETALSRAVWLLNRINESDSEEAQAAAQMLINWERIYPYESPRQIIVGLAATSIPGLTLGKVSRKKYMSMVINKDLRKKSQINLAKLAVQASHGITSKSLDQVKGDENKLDPEVAVWMYGDREVNFYQTNGKEMEKIKKELDRSGVVSEMIYKDSKPLALALSPVVNLSINELSWSLEILR